MISVQEALNFIDKITVNKTEVEQELSEELIGSIISQPIKSTIDLPRFDISAMDGYAVRFGETEDFHLLENDITAGCEQEYVLKPGEAIRIFTGAPRPATADAVVMQEKTEVINQRLKVDTDLKKGQNIRPRGEEIKKGECILDQGQILNPAAIGLIANIGIDKIKTYKFPNCGILTTGDELIPPGNQLTPGKIYDSNSYLLKSFLKSQNIKNISAAHVPDNLEKTKEKIGLALEKNDILLISGGISVGDYDFVKEALLSNGVEEIFHKVKQKPGKPLFFGRKGETFVFGLPGNPASALCNAYVYVLPLINKFKGKKDIHLKHFYKKSVSSFQKKSGRAQFLKASYENEKVQILEGQGSGMLQSFAQSNALVYLDEKSTTIDEGDTLEIIDLSSVNLH